MYSLLYRQTVMQLVDVALKNKCEHHGLSKRRMGVVTSSVYMSTSHREVQDVVFRLVSLRKV